MVYLLHMGGVPHSIMTQGPLGGVHFWSKLHWLSLVQNPDGTGVELGPMDLIVMDILLPIVTT